MKKDTKYKKRKKRIFSKSNPVKLLVLIGLSFYVSLLVYDFVIQLISIRRLRKKVENTSGLRISGGRFDYKQKVHDETNPLIRTRTTRIDLEEEEEHEIIYELRQDRSMDDDTPLPAASWPASILNEVDDFEEILHQGNKKTILSLPKMWSLPITGDGSLMSRTVASRIGLYTNGLTDSDYVKKGNPNERTIFISLASYRDFQCRHTIESIFNRAKYPNRIRIGVVDQRQPDEVSCGNPVQSCKINPEQAYCKHKDQVDVLDIAPSLSVGPTFARHIAFRMYRGEYYVMQIDAHVTFVKDWDVDIINQIEATGNEMAILSTYPMDIVNSISPHSGESIKKERPIMCNSYFEKTDDQDIHLRHGTQPKQRPEIHGMPQLHPYWAAGFSFARGHFAVNVPYDPYLPMVFMGEEISMGIRAFTHGYDLYAPERNVCFHAYIVNSVDKDGEKLERLSIKKFRENLHLYRGVGYKSMKRLQGLIGMNPEVDPSQWDHTEEQIYGIGTVRKPSTFYDIFGIDVVKKVTENRLCFFVQPGAMHEMFTKFLRSDGMGIDYSKIDFRIVDYVHSKQ